jgi:hypothetical protein
MKNTTLLGTEIDIVLGDTLYNHNENRDKYKIDINEVIPPPQVAWSLINTLRGDKSIMGTLGNFSLIVGKAKAKKTFFIGVALSTALTKDVILSRFSNDLPSDKNQVLYFDTEQSKYHVQLAVKRICELTGQQSLPNFHPFYLRSLSPSERLLFIETEILNIPNLGFVVIDGIKDLVTSINDEEQATMIVSKLMKWSEERNIHILTVLHQNKSDSNARGHIGTELTNKAETVLEVAKSESDNSISIVTPLQCRNLEPEIFAFEIDDSGIPIVVDNFELRTETKKIRFDVTDLDETKKNEILLEVFSKGDKFGYKDLEYQIKSASKSILGKELGTNSITSLITHCKNKKMLIQEKPKAPYTIGKVQ